MVTLETGTPAAAEAAPTSPTATTENKDQNKLIGEDKFKYGVIIRGKFIGVEDVKEDHGDEICRTSMIKLKALVLAKKEHKQRICVKITLDGVEILDERTNTPIFNHAVTKISYIARDVDDSRAIGYIYKNGPNAFQYFAIKTLGQAQELFNALKELFEVVLEMRTKAKQQLQQASDAKKEDVAETKSAPAAAAAAPAATEEVGKDQEILGLEDKIKQMNDQPQPSLLDINSDPNNLASSFEDSLNLSPAATTAPTNENKESSKSASDDLFSLMDPATSAPSPQDNALSMLKAQITNIQQFAMAPPRMAPAVPTMNPAANPFGMPSGLTTPPTNAAVGNPFGAMGSPFQQQAGFGMSPNQPPMAGGGFISPTPNIFSAQIPNPQAAVNPNPSSNQLPW